MSSPPITLYSHAGGGINPYKVAVLLEYLKLPYKVIPLPFGSKGVKSPEFVKLNPNGRAPVLIDHSNNDFVVWESAAIMYYLCEKYDHEGTFYGKTIEERSIVRQWVEFQMSGVGPTQGQVAQYKWYWVHVHGAPVEQVVYDRYLNETHRLYQVIESQLSMQEAKGSKFIALERLTIADICLWSWCRLGQKFEIPTEDCPKLLAWVDMMNGMECFKKGDARLSDAFEEWKLHHDGTESD